MSYHRQNILSCYPDRVVVRMAFAIQVCEFCYPDGDVDISDWEKGCEGDRPSNSRCLLQGNAEIRVFGENVIYAAPVLIFHFVHTHEHQPPQEFI